MVDPKKIIIALDYDNIDNALALVDNLNPDLCRLKIGKELFKLQDTFYQFHQIVV